MKVFVNVSVLVLICIIGSKCTKIRYVGSSVWTLFPSSIDQVQKVMDLEKSNSGVFLSDDPEILEAFPPRSSIPPLNLVAPPHLQPIILQNLRAQNIRFQKFLDKRNENRLAGSERKYVVSSGQLPLNVNMRNFEYDIPSDTTLAELYDPVDLIDKITVPNNSPATVIISLSESQTMTQSWELSFTETLTGLIGGNLNLNLPNIGGGGLSASAQIEFSSTQTITQSIERNYGIARQVAIPPFTTIQAHGYVNWLNDLQLPFQVTGQVYLDTKSNATLDDVFLVYCVDGSPTDQCYSTCGRTVCAVDCVKTNTCDCCYYAVTPATAAEPNVMRDYLISKGLRAEVIGLSGNYLLVRLTGTFTASLGTDLIFNVTQILDDSVADRAAPVTLLQTPL